VRVSGFDQDDLLGARPAFQLLLAGDGFVYVLEGGPGDKAFYVVTGGEAFEFMEFVLKDSVVKIAGEADVQSAGQAADDVYAVASALAGTDVKVGMLRLRAALRFAPGHTTLSMTGSEGESWDIRQKQSAAIPEWNYSYRCLVMLSAGGTGEDRHGGVEASLLPEYSLGHFLSVDTSPSQNKQSG
jgi:hypothetical protein